MYPFSALALGNCVGLPMLSKDNWLVKYRKLLALLSIALTLVVIGYVIHMQRKEKELETSGRMSRMVSMLARNGGPPSRRSANGEFLMMVSELENFTKLGGRLGRNDVIRFLGTPDGEDADSLQYGFDDHNISWLLDVECDKVALVRGFGITRPDWFNSATTTQPGIVDKSQQD